MKQLIITMALMIASSALLPAHPPCGRTVTLSGDITASRTLYRDTIYNIDNCVAVTSGNTLTIQDGTLIEFVNNSILMILPGAQINAAGTSVNPIVLTSGVGAPGSRSAVSNAGIMLVGQAAINKGSTLSLPCSRSLTVGSTASDNSGTITYMQLHYLDGPSASGFEHAINLVGVGSGTTLENIQVTNSGRSGFGIIGGAPVLKELVTMDNYEHGIYTGYGAQVQLDGYFEIRKSTSAHYSGGSYGIKVENNPASPSASPVTNIVVNNASVLGPLFCNAAPVSNDFLDGVYIGSNASAAIYNSVIAGYRRNGLFLDGASVIAKTATNAVQFSYNSFYNNGTDYNASPSAVSPGWGAASGCGGTMAAWLTGASLCSETDNQGGSYVLGYDADVCEDYCDPYFGADFVLTGSTELEPAGSGSVYTDRGALQSTNLFGWITACPAEKVYCSEMQRVRNQHIIRFVPNPAGANTLAVFTTATTGDAILSILDRISGKVISSQKVAIREKGEQQIKVALPLLSTGVYPVQIVIKDTIYYGQIVIK